VEIKRAQPCMFHYTPPPQVTEVAAAATAEDADAPAQDAAHSGPNTPDRTSEMVAVPAVVATAAAPVEADFAAETKKRKRIQPMVITALGGEAMAPPSTGSGTSSSTSSSTSTSSASVAADTSAIEAPSAPDTAICTDMDAASAALPKAAKKRIAPQLVQPDGQ
jgi:hypothetical protein